METFLMYLLFAVGILLIVKGGDWFVDGAVWVAEVTRIPKFIIGATIISIATTLPEIIVSTIAAVEGHKILAVSIAAHHIIVFAALTVLADLHPFGNNFCIRCHARRLVIFVFPLCS